MLSKLHPRKDYHSEVKQNLVIFFQLLYKVAPVIMIIVDPINTELLNIAQNPLSGWRIVVR